MFAPSISHPYARPTHPVLAPLISKYYRLYDTLFPPSIGPRDLICLRNLGDSIKLLVGKNGAHMGGQFYPNMHTYLILTPQTTNDPVVIACLPRPSETGKLLLPFFSGSAKYKGAYAITHHQESGMKVLQVCSTLPLEITHFAHLLVQPHAGKRVTVGTNLNGRLGHHGKDLIQTDVTDQIRGL